ncbi:RWD domain-containing protein 4-like [Lineus longissimus]|uniref:RWD domain-containing protein 4-like n=1 Tax=Lineus longissimus TaxID=88925 RepID=UPI002B4D7417
MSCQELQEEEIGVLQSIYDGDENFKQINEKTYQYKIGEDGHFKSFVLEISWGENYPDEMPDINLNAFYNKHVQQEVKETIIEKLKEQADMFIGSAVTYTLFEHAKENHEELMERQKEQIIVNTEESKEEADSVQSLGKKKEKKEQWTKSQKRKYYDRIDCKGERARGWNWVDVIKHLSQTGSADN